MNKRKSMLLAAILTAILCTLAFAAILYTLQIPSQWEVSADYGLELYEGASKITTIQWGNIARYATSVKTLELKNIGNSVANVTLLMPSNTSEYGFSTSFVDYTIIQKYANYSFTISLQDIDMDSASTYSSNFNFSCVD